MSIVSSIVPENITKNDTKSAVEIREDLNYHSAPIRLSFTEGRGKRCALLPDVDEASTD